jgi:hypothetical protein
MSTREDDKGDDKGDEEIDLPSEKTKSLKELKEYLQSGFEKKFPNIFLGIQEKHLCISLLFWEILTP